MKSAVIAVVGLTAATVATIYLFSGKEREAPLIARSVGESDEPDNEVYATVFSALRRSDRKAIVFLRENSSKKLHVAKMLELGIPDLLYSLKNEDADVAFIFANMASVPSSHRYFFSGRFDPSKYLHSEIPAARIEGWRILQNLSFQEPRLVTKKFSGPLLEAKQQGDQAVGDIQRKVLHNVEM